MSLFIVLSFLQLIAVSVANTCGRPPEIERTNVPDLQDEEYALGTEVEYKCSAGYIKHGNKKFISVCELDAESGTGKWTDPQVKCNGRSCGDPGNVDNAKRKGAVFTFPNKVEYECEEGYKLKGQRARYCQPSGTWSGHLPICEDIMCDPPANPENGHVHYNSLKYGEELHYECNKGFDLENYEPRHCTESGTWSNEDPVCTVAGADSCHGEPPAIENGYPVIDKRTHKHFIHYKCNDPYEIAKEGSVQCFDGNWRGETPECTTPKKPTTASGVRSSTEIPFTYRFTIVLIITNVLNIMRNLGMLRTSIV